VSALPFIDRAALTHALPMTAAIDTLEQAFAAGDAIAPPRSHIDVGGGDLLLMPAASPSGVGVKLVTVTPGNPARGTDLIHGVYVLFDAVTRAPRALIDGAAMTGLRTAAVSGLATLHLARTDAARLVVFGAGTQGRAHVDAMLAVRDITGTTVVSRTHASAQRLVDDLSAAGVDARVGMPGSVTAADIVCTCTTSPSPLFDGALLPDGAHVNAVGAYQPWARELDTTTIRRGRLVVEDREAAIAEAGDLAIPIAAGDLRPDDIAADLRQVVTGAAVRRTPGDVTVFKSVGLAIEDLAIAAAAVARLDGGA
jgi:ornithine cyclodeaminase/alanine dehydrogenase-like protein (mu-crystallin family)